MNRRILELMVCLALALALCLAARPAAAEPADGTSGLQSPEQRSLRHSAYALPKGMWAFDLSAFGVTGEDVYGSLGVTHGFGAGVQLELNAAHYAAGLFNIGARWSFLQTKHVTLAANAGFTYGHGAWIWPVNPVLRRVLQDTDLFTVPFDVTASAPVLKWLQFDLAVGARWATIFGTLRDGKNVYADAELGANQVWIRPGARAFITDATEFEVAFDLPLYTRIPWEGDLTAELRDKGYTKTGSGTVSVPLSDSWKFEAGVRSRITSWLFCTVRLHYGRTNRLLYLTTVNPSMSLEFRL